MSPERKVEPSAPTAWLNDDGLITIYPGGEPLYTLDVSRLVWAERATDEARRLYAEAKAIPLTTTDAMHRANALKQQADEHYATARWLRSQDGAR
jgi:hypothetical protein